MAISLLYDRILNLGFNVLFCNETNFQSAECMKPLGKFGIDHCYDVAVNNTSSDIPESDLVITGEWCSGVLDEYGIKSFAGRGIQYHLGFHHFNDMCR